MKRKEPLNEHTLYLGSETMEHQTVENPKKVSRQDPVQREQKYDRQLRLWGNNGQTTLENASVCLINATATGTETLKCLVLPGVGKYFIVDPSDVTEADLSNNFFVNPESTGNPRAQVACELLQELNPDSVGSWLKEDAITLLENDPEFYRRFSVIICSRVNEKDLLKLSAYLWRHNIPLIIADSLGYFGYIRLVVEEHVVTEAHPDNALEDLRLDCPFPELAEYFDNIDMDEMTHLEHSHVAYLVILYKCLQTWQQQTSSNWPQNYKEKCQIKEIIRQSINQNDEGVPLVEENFEEAIRNVNNVFTRTRVPSEVCEILNSDMANHPQKSDIHTKFWILVRALKEFVSQYGLLPLRGSLPDMFSDSKSYIELQRIYKSKADADIIVMTEFVKEALRDMQLEETYVCDDDIRLFCKNSAFLRVFYGLSYHDEVKQELSEKKLTSALELNVESGTEIYILFRTVNKYFNEMKQNSDEIDFAKLFTIASELIRELGLAMKVPTELFMEVARIDFTEFHSLAAIMGGICAQEIVKLITNQYLIVDNVFVMDQISCRTATLKFP